MGNTAEMTATDWFTRVLSAIEDSNELCEIARRVRGEAQQTRERAQKLRSVTAQTPDTVTRPVGPLLNSLSFGSQEPPCTRQTPTARRKLSPGLAVPEAVLQKEDQP